MILGIGDSVPDFDLPADGGGRLSRGDLVGKPFVLYFYPKDDTSGCTKEAKAFSDLADDFAALGVPVVGVSPDSPKSHDKFRAKHGLSLRLVSDETHDMLQAYGVWAEKSMYGRSYMGVERSTLLVGADGRVVQAWPKVKVEGHAEAVLVAAQNLVKAG